MNEFEKKEKTLEQQFSDGFDEAWTRSVPISGGMYKFKTAAGNYVEKRKIVGDTSSGPGLIIDMQQCARKWPPELNGDDPKAILDPGKIPNEDCISKTITISRGREGLAIELEYVTSENEIKIKKGEAQLVYVNEENEDKGDNPEYLNELDSSDIEWSDEPVTLDGLFDKILREEEHLDELIGNELFEVIREAIMRQEPEPPTGFVRR
ncbi:hypothetical protein FWH58_01820 [Candidatus Saccharibacteria bacterium]|nr:hypothetical protein [Candidatus Saccharibacteria bacterium]